FQQFVWFFKIFQIKELCPPKTNGFLVREIASSSTFYYSCNENFIPSTGGKLHCQIPDIPNSKAVSQNDMKITCNHGYILVGTNTIKCTNGEWETPLPECKLDPASCGPPPRADNAIVKILCQKIFMEESRVNYECRKTFVMDGPNEITCKNGIWTTPPICKRNLFDTSEKLNIWYRNLCLQLQRSYVSCSS
uniref:Sushi domain-containing protein n=1 Tax=Esox lucius TaxID=8010 RepID=A0A3P8XY12_ESOLU